MEAIKFTGTLVFVGEVDRIVSKKSGKEFVKRDIAVADDPDAQYPTVVVATLKKTAKADNTKLVTDADLNRPCTLSFFPDGRFYDDKEGRRRAMAGNTAWKVEFMDCGDGVVDVPEAPDAPGVEPADQGDLPF